MFKIKEFYFKQRLEYCTKQYSKYKNLLEVGQSFFIRLTDYYCYIKHKNRYLKLLRKYEKKALAISNKLNIPLPDSFQ